jgi:DNA-binding response OmpR family regulator
MITAKGQAKRILIADDEPGVIMILGMRLRANGYQVIAAHNGMQTIELARREKPDLIVLDIRMPDKDGYAVFEELRASANTRSTPVIFFSALPPEQAEEKAAQLGADGFVSKSADPEEIVARIRGILTRLENEIELTGIRK